MRGARELLSKEIVIINGSSLRSGCQRKVVVGWESIPTDLAPLVLAPRSLVMKWPSTIGDLR